jgi:Uma2 family endonuclease
MMEWEVLTMSTTTADDARARTIPPLEDGQRLSRAEFERRYEAMSEHVKAELIQGVVYMASPVSLQHGIPDGRLILWLGNYATATPGTEFTANSTVRLDDENEPQPDSFLFILPEFGGTARVSADDYVEGTLGLIVQISATTTRLDLGPRLQAYARAGVREYIVWRTQLGVIDWFALRQGQYAPLTPNALGIIRSDVFPGLWLNVPAALRREMAPILATLQQGLESPEHAQFVADLQAHRIS